jgi:predicted small secreted protein
MKIKTQLIWMAFMLGCLGLTGCTSLNTAAKARGSGEQVTYDVAFDKVWAVMTDVIEAAGLQYVSANLDEQMFLAKRGITGWSWGENVAIFVQKTEDGKTLVEVITKRKLVTNVTAREWDGPIFIELDRRFKRA